MNIQEFVMAAAKCLAEYLSKKFTGKITFTLNINQGGIGNVHVMVDHPLKKEGEEKL